MIRNNNAIVIMGLWITLLIASSIFIGCSPTTRFNDGEFSENEDVFQRGKASYYSDKFHGKQTASGAIYDMHGLTAAHPSLPFGTEVEITNLDNGLRVIVVVNDRFPGTKGRIIDVSLGAAKMLQMLNTGVAEVEVRILR